MSRRRNDDFAGFVFIMIIVWMFVLIALAVDDSPEEKHRNCLAEGNTPVTAQVDHDLDPITPDTIIYVACEEAP